jgi:hypothetical protein
VVVSVGVGVGVTVSVGVGVAVGVGVTVGVALEVAELTADAAALVALPIALLTLLPHPVIRHPATMTATGRQTPLLVHRMLVLSRVAILRLALAPVRGDQAGHQSGQEHLAGQGLHDGDGPATVLGRREVPVSERGQRGKAEVLECLGIGGLAACEERRLAQVLYGRVAGREHQPHDEVRAQGAVDALDGDRGLGQHAP